MQKVGKVQLEKFINGGRAIGTLENGKKVFLWGGLPGESVEYNITKSKKSYEEGIVTDIQLKSSFRSTPKDEDSYLSTSPWQIIDYRYELKQKALLIREAFEQEKIPIDTPEVMTDGRQYEYRNKMEYSFWWDNDTSRIELAFFRRGSHSKIPIQKCSLAAPEISSAASEIVEILNELKIEARDLKTLLVRHSKFGSTFTQLYVKNRDIHEKISERARLMTIGNFEIIYSDPLSPASVITERLFQLTDNTPFDRLLGIDFTYSTEGFFQINLPVYEMALSEIKKHIGTEKVVDMYSGVGTIGLTVAKNTTLTLVENNESAVTEMYKNIERLGSDAMVICAESEKALDCISRDATLIVDPPRVGMHKDLVDKVLNTLPPIIIYLSCNPTTQARDIKMLLEKYDMTFIKGYNFFPRTPHIENLAILKRK
jgi:SAM-dependent methyltransferases related to tRNA (uracil-5-)-methyltransferase